MGNNWDNGQLSTLTPGMTLTCGTLATGQIYAIFLYNNQGSDQDATVQVLTTNAIGPQTVTVPGTTSASDGLATIVLFSGTDTKSVAISMTTSNAMPSLQAWIGSVSMPLDTTGLTNVPIPMDGSINSFAQYDRYFGVPETKWYALTLSSLITQFISVQFQENFATVYILNPGPNAAAAVTPIGPSVAGCYTTVKATTPAQTLSTNIFGNGSQWVWMNADSSQDSTDATISVQPLSGVQALA